MLQSSIQLRTSLILVLVAGAQCPPVVPDGHGFGYLAAPATLTYQTTPAFTPVVAAALAVKYHAAPAVATVAAAKTASVTKVDTYHAASAFTSVAIAGAVPAIPLSPKWTLSNHAAPAVTKVTTVEAASAVPKVATVHTMPAVIKVDTTYYAAPVVAATPAITKDATVHAAAPTVTHVDTYQATPTVATLAAALVVPSAPAVSVLLLTSCPVFLHTMLLH
ncbi:hypothetical protein MRX96_051873 [Rhipicephalus microplus]